MTAQQAELQAEMQRCEEWLLHTDFSANPLALDKLFTADFAEISSAGHVASRQAVVAWLLQKDPASRWRISALSVATLTPELRLVRYQARQILPVPSAGKGALHASLWHFDAGLQLWQLQFHQATKII